MAKNPSISYYSHHSSLHGGWEITLAFRGDFGLQIGISTGTESHANLI